MRTLEEILGPDDEGEPQAEKPQAEKPQAEKPEAEKPEADHSSPAAVGRDGEEAPPPCPTSR